MLSDKGIPTSKACYFSRLSFGTPPAFVLFGRWFQILVSIALVHPIGSQKAGEWMEKICFPLGPPFYWLDPIFACFLPFFPSCYFSFFLLPFQAGALDSIEFKNQIMSEKCFLFFCSSKFIHPQSKYVLTLQGKYVSAYGAELCSFVLSPSAPLLPCCTRP